MKKCIKYSLISLPILLILVTILFELMIRNIPNEYNYKANYLKNNGYKIETLILGSSHTFYGINPNLLNNSFSAAHSSQSYDLDWKILKNNIKSLPNLKNVILPSSYFSYVRQMKSGTEINLIKNYNIYYGINTNVDSLKYNYEIFNSDFKTNFKKFKLFYKYNYHKMNINLLGDVKIRNKKDSLEWLNSTSVFRHTRELNKEIIKSNIDALENILNLCQEKNINVIIISTPTSQSYRENVELNQYNHWFVTTTDISKKYNNVVWFNYLNNYKFDYDDFVDSDHLNEQGANKLTNLIKSYLK